MAGTLKTIVKIGARPATTNIETIRGRGVRDTFSGRTTNAVYARAAASRIDIEIARMMVGSLLENEISRGPKSDQGVMATAMRNAAQAEASQLITFISRWLLDIDANTQGVKALIYENMAQLRGGGGLDRSFRGGGRPLQGQVDWHGLGRRYLHEKKDKRFFRNTGKLARSIMSMRNSYPDSLGGITVERLDFTKSRKKQLANLLLEGPAKRAVILGTIEVKIFPKADRGLFPGLMTGNWAQTDALARLENSGFFQGSTRRKLRGPTNDGFPFRFRPIFGPVTQFWMLHRIPSAMAAALKKSSKARK